MNLQSLLFALLSLAAVGLFLRRTRPFEPYTFDRGRTLPLRGLLALLVVVGHCDLRLPGSPLLKMLHLATPAVSVFFFLSGYGLVKAVLRNRAGYLDGFVPRAFVKLAVPLATATALECLFLVSRGEHLDLLQRGWQLLTAGRNFPYHSWYVYALLFHYLSFAAAFAGGSVRRGLFLFAGFSLVYYTVFRFGLQWPSVWWRTSPAMLLGALWASGEERILAAIRRSGWRFYLAVCAVMAFGIVCERIPAARLPAVKEARLLCLLTAGPATALAMYALRGVPRPLVAVFTFLGGISFEIYLLHFLGERGFDRLFPNAPLLYCGAAVALAVAAAWPMHHVNAALVRLTGRVFPKTGGRG